MNKCRVCGEQTGAPIYTAGAPSITSLSTLLGVGTSVWICRKCEHAQSADIPDVQKFYDTDYQISMATEEHDQLYGMADGQPVYRTDRQAAVVLELTDLPRNAKVLDFGCGKAKTLQKAHQRRPDIEPYVFDVSESYRQVWASWLKPDHCATHELPASWHGRFDLVTAHYVLEHVVDPVSVLRRIRSLLNPNGRVFFSVPDTVANPGDLIVVDHLNHFTPRSLLAAAKLAGFEVVALRRDLLPTALVAVAVPGTEESSDQPSHIAEIDDLASFWTRATTSLKGKATRHKGRRAAIYGAGVYGTWIAGLIRHQVTIDCFIDNSRHLQGTTHLGVPVIAPAQLPASTEVLFAGLNPKTAKSIVENTPALQGRQMLIEYIG